MTKLIIPTAFNKRRRIPARMLSGLVLLAMLIAANIAAYIFHHERSDSYLCLAPSHIAIIRTALGAERARESSDATASFAFGFNCSGDAGSDASDSSARLFGTSPAPIARVGRPYTYRPSLIQSGNTDRWSVEAIDAAGRETGWLAVDPQSGVLTGTPLVPTTLDVRLTAKSDDGRARLQQWKLYVDDRFLLLGTDNNGRDVARALLEAMQSTVLPATIAALIVLGVGVPLGALSGFFGGRAASLLIAISSAVQSIPGILLIALAGRLSGWNLLLIMAAVGVVLLPETASGVRELVERFKRRDFVEAARELGMSDNRILWDEIVWHNGRQFIVERVAQSYAAAVLAEVTLGFLDLTDSLTPSLGRVLLVGREVNAPAMLVPALLLLLLVIGCFSLLPRGFAELWGRPR